MLRTIVKERGPTFAHGLLCAHVLGLSLCVTHLNPHDVRRRANEAHAIALRAASSGPFMLVGDLNTLSSLDEREHASSSLTRKINQGPFARQLRKKFLDPPASSIDYTPMQVLIRAPKPFLTVSPHPSPDAWLT